MSEPAHDSSQPPVRRLRRRFVAAISLLVAVVLVALTAILVLFGYGYLRLQIEARARAYAALASGPLCDAYQTYFASGATKFRTLMAEIALLEPNLTALAIYDTEGTLLAYSDTPREPESFTAPARPLVSDGARLQRAVRGLEQVAWEDANDGSRRYVVVAPDVEDWGRHRYTAVFLVGYEGLRQALATIAWQIGLLALLALGLGVGCAFLLADQSLGPLERLTRGARKLAEGRLDHRIGLASGDEFQVLGETLDRMAARLATTIEDLEASNQNLERLNAELEALDRVKSDLLANVSHELRTPLTAIRGYTEAMEAGLLGPVAAAQDKAIQVVHRNIRRLQAMIDQLLSYARLEQGTLVLERQPFDLEAAVRGVVEGLMAIHGPALRLEVEIEEGLPAVEGDRGRILQVLENLLTNAIKFTPDGGHIKIGLRRREAGVAVTVSDEGIGIAAADQEKIFERFFQVDASAKRKYSGIGLGLAIVREILELHGSSIAVESQLGKGTTFRFTLPLVIEEATEEAAMPAAQQREPQGRRSVGTMDGSSDRDMSLRRET